MTDAPRHHIAAILPCSDLDASTAFYERLGLSVVSDHGTYRLLEDGKGWQLHLTNESQPTWPERDQNPFGLYLYSERVDELAEAVRERILGPEKAPTHKPWGMYEFALSDPDETLVRIGWPSGLIG
ncbi:VOC family protein [Sphingopyxis sp. RIFCSPHIGHO2_12_FULL_65_19]|uniref:VOC family protein n=1 Tax=Sphingopyxis sp. RIFCSPHIGHO2_12_FULL_65_19 TaxID=1802172 RepID=UPI0008BDD2B0|nr:VOC family protein [Sphingopyxis sp. RIFCSPHIGHO2_12_FULL_65_19]OHD08841.1 MAG: glyoxalase [Sphingopyxis sp. RIFCSPHIGHO2_12_FULL_65_19]